METLSFPLFWCSLEQLLKNDSAFPVSCGSCLAVGRAGCTTYHPYTKVPKGAYTWWETRSSILVWNHHPSVNTQAPISPSVSSHLPHSALIQPHHCEWVIITVSVSKRHVNSLRSSIRECNKLSSIIQREEIRLLNINSTLEIRI